MAHSYRTEKPSVIARNRMPRGRDGRIVYPRVIERKPAPGDVHPLPKHAVWKILRLVPIEYVYGLDRVELRARQKNEIGNPFGCYLPDEKAIFLYSLPPVWRLPRISEGLRRSVESFDAKVTVLKEEKLIEVRWPEEDGGYIDVWFWFRTFTHELGHHFVEQYKTRKGANYSRRHEEIVADLHSSRLAADFFRRHQ